MASRCATAVALAMACLILLFLASPAHAGRAVPAAAAKAQEAAGNATADEYLAPHNEARREVGVDALRWSGALAASAAATTAAAAAQQRQQPGRPECAFADMGGSAYGANQGWASYRARPAEVVAMWVAQGRYYSHGNNSCVRGRECGTYTQVVWRRTAEVGCAQASCASGATLTLCLYNPHGNVQGQSPY